MNVNKTNQCAARMALFFTYVFVVDIGSGANIIAHRFHYRRGGVLAKDTSNSQDENGYKQESNTTTDDLPTALSWRANQVKEADLGRRVASHGVASSLSMCQLDGYFLYDEGTTTLAASLSAKNMKSSSCLRSSVLKK